MIWSIHLWTVDVWLISIIGTRRLEDIEDSGRKKNWRGKKKDGRGGGEGGRGGGGAGARRWGRGKGGGMTILKASETSHKCIPR